MKKTFFFINVFIICFSANSQNPSFDWVKLISDTNNGNAVGSAIILDASGNIYTTGYFQNVRDFDPGLGTYTLSGSIDGDIFVQKLDPNGNFLWAKQFVGYTSTGQISFGSSISNDESGNVYVTGCFFGTVDFDPGPGSLLKTAVNYSDIFIVKLDVAGNLIWAKVISGNQNFDVGYSVALDSKKNVYTVGYFAGQGDFDPGPGVYNLSAFNSTVDGFISKLDSNGNFVWAKNVGGPWVDLISCISIDSSENLYAIGNFSSTVDFDIGPGIFNITSIKYDVFVLKIDTAGNFISVKTTGALNTTPFYSPYSYISIDQLGNIYTMRYFEGTVDFDPGASVFNLSSSGESIFISKLNASGNFAWARQICDGVVGIGKGRGLTTDKIGNPYVTGYFSGNVDFDPGTTTYNLNSISQKEGFIVKLNPSGNFLWAKQFACATSNSESPNRGVAIDSSFNVYTTGQFFGNVDFDPGPAVYTLTSSVNFNGSAYIHKMSQAPVGIIENSLKSNVFIYPNPTNEFLNIELENLDKINIEIANALGQVVFEEMIEFKNAKLNIENLKPGLYFLKIIKEDEIIATQKIIKE